jgi:pyridoxal phosphate enzyme (YggS family)
MGTVDVNRRLRDNLERVRATIAEACRRSARSPDDVRLVAVTKYVDLEIARTLLEAGVHDLGENRVQQLVSRAEALGAANLGLLDTEPPERGVPRWHMIGHLQRNKVRNLLRYTRILHSLDSLRLAEELEKQAEKQDLTVDAFLEVNVAGEESKSGAPLSGAPAIADAIMRSAHITLRGLMTMAPFASDPEDARPYFARLRELLEQLRRDGAVGPDCVHLSMGMTIDYAVAIEEGATFVRIGSALFEGIDDGTGSGPG